MSTLNDVQNAMVNVLTPALYPNGTSQPSIAGNKLSGFTITNPGSNYTQATISFTGGGGQDASAQAVIVGGEISQINLITQGFAYASAPTVVITGDGTGAAATALLTPVIIYIAAGDFLKQDVDAIVLAGDIAVPVFAVNGMTRNTTRVRREYTDSVITAATITLTVAGDTVTVGGTITAGQASMVIVNGTGYAYAALSNDTPTSIATALAALIPTASSLGAVITVPGVFNLVTGVSTSGQSRRILHSQESVMRARVIASDYAKRELVASSVQLAFAEFGYYLPMPDLISASIRPNRIMEVNMFELDNVFARDYLYLVEYHTVQVSTYQTITDAYVTQTFQ